MKNLISRIDPPGSLPTFSIEDIYAIRAVRRGEASAEQQIRAFRWIVEKVSIVGASNIYHNPHDMAISVGRSLVGKHLMNLTSIPIEAVAKEAKNE